MIECVNTFKQGNEEVLHIVAENQTWDKATLEQLRKEHNIIFMSKGYGVAPVMIVEREHSEPLFVIGSEDDGVISFVKHYGHYDNSMSAYWVGGLLFDLEEALKISGYCD